MEDRSSRRVRTLVTRKARRGLSADEIACALISMMARSTCSNQRPDTLMQDRICQVDETSCNARPDHTFGSKPAVELSRPGFAPPCQTDILRWGGDFALGPTADMQALFNHLTSG
jgi:hypothetical protein